MFYYVRWPNGDQTIACAPSKKELWFLLDEEADAVDALLKKVPSSRFEGGFAFDFVSKKCKDDGEVFFEYEVKRWYEAMRQTLREYSKLPDAALTPGHIFFGVKLEHEAQLNG